MSKDLFITHTDQDRSCLKLLSEHLDDFVSDLLQKGYSLSTVRAKYRLISALSHWLEGRAVDLSAFDEAKYQLFLTETGAVFHSPQATGRQLLEWLRANRLTDVAIESDIGHPLEFIRLRYRCHILDECGLSAKTVKLYLQAVGVFLDNTFATRTVDLKALCLDDVYRHIRITCRELKPATIKVHVTALRSFFAYLYWCGDIPTDLRGGIFAVRNKRLSNIPRFLEPNQVENLINSCDVSCVQGRRDRAVLLLLARLGLRAVEVAHLTLDDINWFKAVVTITGKGGRRDQLPLPDDVGAAITDYLLNGRSECTTRSLFVTVKAPYRGFQSSSIVRKIFRNASERTGVNTQVQGGPHLLRHSMATTMLRNGALLEDIGQILRHNCPDSTRIYAKVDFDSLRPLAPQWPGGAL